MRIHEYPAGSRGNVEILIARVIDWLAQRFTPNTIYYTRHKDPFLVLDDEREEMFGTTASHMLVRLVIDADKTKLTSTVRQLDIDGEPKGSWQVTVERIAES